MQRLYGVLALASLWSVLGCGTPASPRPGPARGASDKAALFGDPSLVPTRQGERARREVALAQEIEQALAVLPSVDRARVDVELARPVGSSEPPPRVLAVVAGRPESDATELALRARSIVQAVMGPGAVVEVVMEPSPTAPPLAERTRWPLLLGILGLGFFIGVLLERIRGLRRPGAARHRS
jgi:hypothetical protein